jgi:Trk K+ transport system NAD-binding subunit
MGGGVVENWTGHVIVCGLHEEGLRTVEQLHLAGVQVVVIDDRPAPRLPRIIQAWGVPLIERDSRSPETLAAAGLSGAVAVICAESGDLHTLETALLVRELNPQARVVVQMRNPAVGRAIEGTGVAVLDVARLSAPSLVEACLRTGAHAIDLAGARLVSGSIKASGRGTLRALYGDLTPVAVEPRDGGAVVICPGRDHRVQPGDVVTLLGTPAEVRAAGIQTKGMIEEARPEVLVPVGARFRVPGDDQVAGPWLGLRAVRWLRQVIRSLRLVGDRRLRLVFAVLFGLILFSTVVLRLGYHDQVTGQRMSVLDALYFTVETIGTVGYGDFYFRDQPSWLRVFAIGLMLVGAMVATVFFALLTNVLVSRRIEESLGRLRVTRLAGHVVVIGLGSIGIRVVGLLVERGHQVVVVEADQDNRYLAQARHLGVPVVDGDATQAETLSAVHLQAAAAVAVLTSDDLTNIETGLAILDQLGPRRDEVPLVLRLFDRRLARTVEASFGFSSVRSTAALAAPWFVGAALGLEVASTFYVGDTPMLVASLQVAQGGGLDGLALRDLSARTRVVAITRADGTFEYPPRRDTTLAHEDTVYLVGPYEEMLHVLRTDNLAPLPRQ